MAKLFSKEDDVTVQTELGRLTREGHVIPLESLDLSSSSDDFKGYMELGTEHLNDLNYKLRLSDTLSTTFGNTEVGSKEYLYGLESFSSVIKSLGTNLGVRVQVASLEDFTNQYSVQASHTLAMEGVVSFFKKIWEKIKSFFRSFLKRITDFMKRITNSNLDLGMYEKYVSDLISKIRKNDLKPKDITLKITTKLPLYVSREGELEPLPKNLIDGSRVVCGNLSNLLTGNFLKALKGIEDNSIKPIETIIKSIGEYTHKDITLERLYKDINVINAVLNSMVTSISDKRINDGFLPFEVGERLRSLIDTSTAKNVNYQALYTPNDDTSRLPRHFNIYTVTTDVVYNADSSPITSEDDISTLKTHLAVGIASSQTEDTGIAAAVPVIDNVSNMEALHKIYKDFIKCYDKINDIETLVKKLEKTINKNLELMTSKVTDRINNLKYVQVTAHNPYDVLIMVSRHMASIGDHDDEMERIKSDNNKFITKLRDGLDVNKDKEVIRKLHEFSLKLSTLEEGDPFTFIEASKQDLEETLSTEAGAAAFNKAYSSFEMSELGVEELPDGISEEDALKIQEALTLIEISLGKTFTGFQQLIKSTCVELAVNFTETRYSMIKYLYDSARTYG